MDTETVDRWLERVILGLVLAALAFAILGFAAVRVQEWLVVQGLVGLAVAVGIVRLWVNPDLRLLWPPACWGVLAFAGYAVWRWTEADVEHLARGELARILTYAALFFVIVNNLHRQATTQAVVVALLGLAVLLGFLAAWQFATQADLVWGLSRGGGYGRRAGATYVNPNHFAGLLALLLPVAVALAIAGRMRVVWRVVLVYAVLVLLAALGFTISRGGFLAAGAGLLFTLALLMLHRDYRLLALAGAALLLVGGSVVAWKATRDVALSRRITEGFDEADKAAINSRQHIWPATAAMWRDHRGFGVGPGHFATRFKQYRTAAVFHDPGHAHNDYLQALAEWGVVGAALAAVPFLLLGWGVWRTHGQVQRAPADLEVRRSSKYAFVVGAAGGLVALLVQACFDFNWHIPANALVAVTWMALLTGYLRFATDAWWLSARGGWRAAATLLGLALLAPLGWDVQHRGRETVHLLRAARAPVASEARLAELRAAWAIEPLNPQTAYDLGEHLRLRAVTGAGDRAAQLAEAVTWFERAVALNPHDRSNHLGLGRALDLAGRRDEAGRAFAAALQVDPNGRITSFFQGWHALRGGDVQAAEAWFVKSIGQGWPQYEPALRYLGEIRAGRLPEAGVIQP